MLLDLTATGFRISEISCMSYGTFAVLFVGVHIFAGVQVMSFVVSQYSFGIPLGVCRL